VTAFVSRGIHTCMSRLWNVDDQAARLAELTSQESDLKEAPLRRDVRSLGHLPGDVLKEQVGDRV
jgi:phosphoenolpyruvate carboxylase